MRRSTKGNSDLSQGIKIQVKEFRYSPKNSYSRTRSSEDRWLGLRAGDSDSRQRIQIQSMEFRPRTEDYNQIRRFRSSSWGLDPEQGIRIQNKELRFRSGSGQGIQVQGSEYQDSGQGIQIQVRGLYSNSGQGIKIQARGFRFRTGNLNPGQEIQIRINGLRLRSGD
jgi:hypothetical protein